MNGWWLMWILFLFVFLISPVGYGWGYRGWGAPYPRYVQRRRMQRATVIGGSEPYNHEAWSWGGDLLWLLLMIWIFWALAAIWWL